jgi:hypothetical protein
MTPRSAEAAERRLAAEFQEAAAMGMAMGAAERGALLHTLPSSFETGRQSSRRR